MAIDRNSRDLAITPGRFALVLDRTKGYVETLTGPFKSSLADTQTPVKPEPGSETGYREFEPPFAGAMLNSILAGTPLADTFKKLRGAVTEVAGAGAPKKDRPGSGVA
jgi:hypothetical protein